MKRPRDDIPPLPRKTHVFTDKISPLGVVFDRGYNPEDEYLDKAQIGLMRDILALALSQCTDREQEIMRLWRLNYTEEEIAAIIGVTRQAVYQQIERTVNKIRLLMRDSRNKKK